MNRALIGWVMKGLGVIGVERSGDSGIKGVGLILRMEIVEDNRKKT